MAEFKINAEEDVKSALISHIGESYSIVLKLRDEFFRKTQRHAYIFKNHFLSFIILYKEVYEQKLQEINIEL